LDQRFNEAGLFYGHGSDNSWDEAVFMVLSACDLPLTAGQEVAGILVSDLQAKRISDWSDQRTLERKPLPYITGRAWLGGVEFLCDPRALVPRSPLAEVVSKHYQPWLPIERRRNVLDLCCGGGSLGILAALKEPESRVILSDIDPNALDLAQANLIKYQLAGRVSCVQSNVLASVPKQAFDVVLCNPPYVDAEDMASLPPEYLHEPGIALASGGDGLDFTRQLLHQLPAFLHPGSVVFLELGNSWEHFDQMFSKQALTWLEFEHGGWGVCVLLKPQIEELARTLA
jgi:ribosomal protein L3 glutamine methyltransferase